MASKKQDKIKILDKTLQRGFTPLPRVILRNPSICRNSKCTYALLLDYAWQKGSCFPGQGRLACDLGVSIRTIQRDLDDLKLKKLIDWEQRGRNKTNIYYILPLESIVDNKALKERDTTEMSCPDTSNLSPPDTTKMSYRIEEGNRKRKEYKQTLTLGSSTSSEQSNDNGLSVEDLSKTEEINLNSFDSEAIALAEEFDDLKSIKFYQKLINQRNKGEITDEDIQSALADTRRVIRTDQVDGTNFLKNPAGWFVSILKKLTDKREAEEKQARINNMLNEFKSSFLNKSEQ